MPESSERLLLTTTTGDRSLAERIATELVDRRLAACVQIDGPVTSVFRWDGAVTMEQEYRLTCKSVARHLTAIGALMDELHTYDVPELVATPIVGGSDEYLAWVDAETR